MLRWRFRRSGIGEACLRGLAAEMREWGRLLVGDRVVGDQNTEATHRWLRTERTAFIANAARFLVGTITTVAR
jgi:hypothetical protein